MDNLQNTDYLNVYNHKGDNEPAHLVVLFQYNMLQILRLLLLQNIHMCHTRSRRRHMDMGVIPTSTTNN
jgi:hypothetical protein